MTVNYLAILAATVLSWFAGAGWYSALGKHWMSALGWRQEDLPQTMPVGPMVTSFVAELVMAFMLAGLMVHIGASSVRGGVVTALHVWVAFIATTTVVNNGFQRRPFKLSLIDGGHWLLVLVLQGLVLGYFS